MEFKITNISSQLHFLLSLTILLCGGLTKGEGFSLVLENILPGNSAYDKVTPPKPEGGSPANVTFRASILSVTSLDSLTQTFKVEMFLAQTWKDSRLRLPEIGSLEKRNLPVEWLENLWRPDAIFSNAKNVEMEDFSIRNHYLLMFHDKTIQYVAKPTVQVSCPMDFSNYPHAGQECELNIESLSQTTDSLIFEWDIDSLDVQQLTIPVEIQTQDCISTRAASKGNVTCLKLMFSFSPLPSFIIFHTFFPAILLVVLSWISFWIHPEDGCCRVLLGLATTLALGWINHHTHQDLPKVQYLMAIDIFLLGCTVFVFLTLIEFLIVITLMGQFKNSEALEKVTNRRRKSIWIDFVCRGLFPLAFVFFNVAYWCTFKF